jgi:methylated-DNA-[protein]-cysteine S-methyltransferase
MEMSMQENNETEKIIDGLFDGTEDRELTAMLARIDDYYQQGPEEERKSRAYTDLKRILLEAPHPRVAFDRLEGTPFGDLLVAVSDIGVVALHFGGDEDSFRARLEKENKTVVKQDSQRVAFVLSQLDEYFKGKRSRFEIDYDLSGLTKFQRRVLEAVQRVPKGSYVTYLELAKRIGKPKAARAVGQALGSNPIPILIPCHRVIATDGSLGGYSGPGGVQTKNELLRMEGAIL